MSFPVVAHRRCPSLHLIVAAKRLNDSFTYFFIFLGDAKWLIVDIIYFTFRNTLMHLERDNSSIFSICSNFLPGRILLDSCSIFISFLRFSSTAEFSLSIDSAKIILLVTFLELLPSQITSLDFIICLVFPFNEQ